ncbi:MAG: MotA/TolQ/ExbB proton channel family protein [Methylococcales bacterium]
MADNTNAAPVAPQAATQTGTPVAGSDASGAVNTAPAALSQAAPTAINLNNTSSSVSVPSEKPEVASGAIVDATLWVLIGFSVVTWALIFIKGIQHVRLGHHNRVYSKKFWAAKDFQAASALQDNKGPAARVADIGFATLIEADGGTTTHDLEHTGDRQELLDRRLRQQLQKERGSLESGLSILATIGSISPFVGLFGTVWGIMGALTNISKSGSANLEVVAGPIGEALIATAVGIAVAVPAVIGYNFFIRRNKVVWAFLEDFSIEFVHLALKTSFLITRTAGNSTVANKPRGGETIAKKTALNIQEQDLETNGAQI